MGKIVFKNFNEGDGYYKVNLAYLSKEQVEEIEALISKWNPTDEDIKDCIRICLTDANEQRFKNYGTNLKDCLAWLEKQGGQKCIKPATVIESEDERIKEDLIQWINEFPDTIWRGHYKKDIIAWLEKQAEQKPADKVGPKFKVGDWVVCEVTGLIYQIGQCIENLSNHKYGYDLIGGGYVGSDEAEFYHLWTIQDAKDGDVLAFSDDTIVIFKDLYNSSSFHSYCHIEDGEFGISEDDMPDWWKGKGFLPATKEQRELLYSKMKDAGYEWDEEKKELRRKVEPKFKVGDWITNKFRVLCLITDIDLENGYYICESNRFGNTDGDIDLTDKAFHLWTIQDAKDGDVLITSAGVFIYNGNNGGGSCPGCYCGIDTLGIFKFGVKTHWTGKKVYPATKEQQDLLFQKMKEIGYEWDAEKKELRKIEKQGEQKPTWTDEDEANLNNIIWLCNNCLHGEETTWIPSQAEKIKHLIETIKERGLTQQMPTWTEEDESKVEDIVYFLNTAKTHYASTEAIDDCVTWLKSLQERMDGNPARNK